jgi:hypothetical protein
MSKEISPQICVLHILDREEKTFIAINSCIQIWDTYWLAPVWYQLISCIIYPFMLCVYFFFFFFFFGNLWSYCSMCDSVHKTKNRPLDLFHTDCINPNFVTIIPSQSIWYFCIFPFFTDCCLMDIYSTSQHFSIYVIGNFTERLSTYH